MNEHEPETRQERREKRLKKKQSKIPQHGKSLGKVYRDAVIKKVNLKEK
jgi:hypothetical protein